MMAKNEIARIVPPDINRKLIWLSDTARLNGIHVMGGPGSGKSRLAGRSICWLDFARGIPLIIIDPTGGTWANLCQKILFLSAPLQQQAWKRVLYVDMSGCGEYVVPFPLYYRAHDEESLFTTAQRYLEVVRRQDPALAHASVEGMNALSRLWTHASMVLIALGYQVTEVTSLIRAPELWRPRFGEALARYPEVKPALDFFQEYIAWSPEQRARRADSLLVKLLPFEADPTMRAMFGASRPGVDWAAAVAEGRAVILDFSHEQNADRRRFKLLWVFLSLVEYLEQRGIAGRNRPISLVIDEVTQLLGHDSAQSALLSDDFEKLVSVIARNYGVWLTIAHQSLAQIEERMRNVLMQMGTQVIGVMPNPHDALYLAQQFTQYDPSWVKKKEPVWMSLTDPNVIEPVSVPTIIDWRQVEYNPEEQLLLAADEFRSLSRFRFLVRTAQGEGDMTSRLRRMSIARLDAGQYPDHALISEVEQRLTRRGGIAVSTVLNDVAKRLQTEPEAKNHLVENATMKVDAHHLQTPAPDEDDDDETFRTKA